MGRREAVIPDRDAAYRFQLAERYLQEAEQDFGLDRWRSCVDNCQLAAENAAKAVLALVGPLPRTHEPASDLRRALAAGRLASSRRDVERFADLAAHLGWRIHIATAYGEEDTQQTPWDLFGHPEAEAAVGRAREAHQLSSRVLAIENSWRQSILVR